MNRLLTVNDLKDLGLVGPDVSAHDLQNPPVESPSTMIDPTRLKANVLRRIAAEGRR